MRWAEEEDTFCSAQVETAICPSRAWAGVGEASMAIDNEFLCDQVNVGEILRGNDHSSARHWSLSAVDGLGNVGEVAIELLFQLLRVANVPGASLAGRTGTHLELEEATHALKEGNGGMYGGCRSRYDLPWVEAG